MIQLQVVMTDRVNLLHAPDVPMRQLAIMMQPPRLMMVLVTFLTGVQMIRLAIMIQLQVVMMDRVNLPRAYALVTSTTIQ